MFRWGQHPADKDTIHEALSRTKFPSISPVCSVAAAPSKALRGRDSGAIYSLSGVVLAPRITRERPAQRPRRHRARKLPPPREGRSRPLRRNRQPLPREVPSMNDLLDHQAQSIPLTLRSIRAIGTTATVVVQDPNGANAAERILRADLEAIAANAVSTAAIVWGRTAFQHLNRFDQSVRIVRHDGRVVCINGWPEESAP
jgi:hypothetical protein